MIFAIVHYNTPLLTKCLIASVKRNHPSDSIVVFDNSDKNPIEKNALISQVFDNTSGRIINFEYELSKFPNRDIDTQIKLGVNFGSAKHSMSINWLCHYIEHEFILLDSDVLLKQPIDFIDNRYACICEPYNNIDGSKVRCSPMLCYLNVDMLNNLHINYFDSTRMLALNKYDANSMKYDTGSSLYEDLASKSLIKPICISDYIVHYGNGSWSTEYRSGIRHTVLSPTEWLFTNRQYFMI